MRPSTHPPMRSTPRLFISSTRGPRWRPSLSSLLCRVGRQVRPDLTRAVRSSWSMHKSCDRLLGDAAGRCRNNRRNTTRFMAESRHLLLLIINNLCSLNNSQLLIDGWLPGRVCYVALLQGSLQSPYCSRHVFETVWNWNAQSVSLWLGPYMRAVELFSSVDLCRCINQPFALVWHPSAARRAIFNLFNSRSFVLNIQN